jgi:hypothetical protein
MKHRFDYIHQTCTFIIRTPSNVNILFTSQIFQEISSQLRKLRKDALRADIAETARSVGPRGRTTVALTNDTVHSPDFSFGSHRSLFPCLMIEVSCPQKRKDLPRLAHDYIAGSQGNIKAVVCFNIEYARSKKATVSVWESRMRSMREFDTCFPVKTTDEKVRSLVLTFTGRYCSLTLTCPSLFEIVIHPSHHQALL